MKPIIHLYTISWNEEKFLKFFFEHYDPIVDQYFFYDDESDDGTLEILEAHPKVIIKKFQYVENSYVLSAQKLHETHWKFSKGKADWVIVTAVDELLYHENFIEYLNECKMEGISLIPGIGLQIISENFPLSKIKLFEQIEFGFLDNYLNKLNIFDPNKIESTNYSSGRHIANPIGEIKYPATDEVINFHFKYLSEAYSFNRHNELWGKLKEIDKEKNFGIHYNKSEDEFKKFWDIIKNKCFKIDFKTTLADRIKLYDIPRWWR
jgi:hypothetical protein